MAKFSGTGARTSNRAAIARLQARLDGLSSASIEKADRRAIASVRRKFEPAAKRVIRERYNIKTGDLAGKFQVRSGSDGGSDYLELFASTRKIPLLRFGGRWGGRRTAGATARILTGESKVYKSAFIATIGGEKRLVARQFSADSNSPSGRSPRNKLRTLMGPSPFQMVRGIDDVNAIRISTEMNEFRASEILRQLKLARLGAS